MIDQKPKQISDLGYVKVDGDNVTIGKYFNLHEIVFPMFEAVKIANYILKVAAKGGNHGPVDATMWSDCGVTCWEFNEDGDEE